MGWAHIERSFRLTNEPGGLGLSCTESGLSLAGVSLLQKSKIGFVPRSTTEIEALVQAAYSGDVAADDLLPGVDLVARALNRGEIARAMIAAVLMRLPELNWNSAARLAHAEDRIGKYSPDEPRDWRGRWTTGNAADNADQVEGRENPVAFDNAPFAQNAHVAPVAFVISQNDRYQDEPAPPDDRSPLERKYDDLGPVEFAKKVIQFGWSLGTDGQQFSPEQRQEALAEYKFLQDRLNFWLAYDNKPFEAGGNLRSAALELYTGAVLSGIVPVGGKGGDLPASMVAAAIGTLAVDNGTPGVRVRGAAGRGEVEPEAVPVEREPARSEEESAPSRGQSGPEGSSHVIEELTRTGELSSEIISNDEAKINWDGTINPGLQWEDYNSGRYPELRRLKTGAKAFDFSNDVSGEALSDKALDPLRYSYINDPRQVYRRVTGYIDQVANYSKPRAWFDLKPDDINSKTLRLAVRDYFSPAQWESLYRAVLYARSRGVRIIVSRIKG